MTAAKPNPEIEALKAQVAGLQSALGGFLHQQYAVGGPDKLAGRNNAAGVLMVSYEATRFDERTHLLADKRLTGNH